MGSDSIISLDGAEIDVADKLQELSKLVEQADTNLQNALAHNTRLAYKRQWNSFLTWCVSMGLPSMPATDQVILIYLTHRVEKGASVSTITQAYAAIREQHRMANLDPPTLDGKLYRSWTGARKKSSRGRTTKKATALTPEHLKSVVSELRGQNTERDRALLLVGWCGALRSDEIISLDQSDISVSDEGMRVVIRHSKTDQWGSGHEIGIARASRPEVCPVQAWVEYQATADPARAAAFVSRTEQRLSRRDVNRILKRSLKRANLPTAGYSAHSLRSGCITAAAKAGHSLQAIQRQSRHKSLEVLLGYVQTATLLQDNVTEGLL